MKFWLDLFLHRTFRSLDSAPVRDESIRVGFLFSGYLRRFVARRIAKRDLSFVYSLQKGSKRFWPQLGELKEAQALEKHRERLTSPEGVFGTDGIRSSHPTLLRVISLTALHIFQRLPKNMTKLCPSGSACLQAGRQDGGALGMIGIRAGLETPLGVLREIPHQVERAREEIWEKCYDHISNTSLSDLTRLEVIAVAEPGKFRIITKGDGYLYTALQPLQGGMLAAWKQSRYSTMLDDDLTQKVRSIDSLLPYWVSVDYEAATDLLNRDATMEVLYVLPEPLRTVALQSFMPGFIKYPKDTREFFAFEGQPMGHPLSFPILCIINLAVYRYALLRRFAGAGGMQLYRFYRDKVIVNGDDMLFKADQELFDDFRKISSLCGFKISAGKNYLSKDCCMINSQIFRHIDGKMTRLGYLNLKLVKQFSIKSKDSVATPFEVGPQLTKMVDLCPWTASAVPEAFRIASQRFHLRFNHAWYLPLPMGGFGCEPRCGPPSWRPSREQRLLAAHLVSDKRTCLTTQVFWKFSALSLAPAVVSNYRWFFGEGPLPLAESEGNSWLERLALFSRLSHTSDEIGLNGDQKKILFPKIPRRLHPMSHKRLREYASARLVYSSLGSPPPLSSFVYDSLAQLWLPESFDESDPGVSELSEVQETVDGTGGSEPPYTGYVPGVSIVPSEIFERQDAELLRLTTKMIMQMSGRDLPPSANNIVKCLCCGGFRTSNLMLLWLYIHLIEPPRDCVCPTESRRVIRVLGCAVGL
jgi:hypothetical protein